MDDSTVNDVRLLLIEFDRFKLCLASLIFLAKRGSYFGCQQRLTFKLEADQRAMSMTLKSKASINKQHRKTPDMPSEECDPDEKNDQWSVCPTNTHRHQRNRDGE